MRLRTVPYARAFEFRAPIESVESAKPRRTNMYFTDDSLLPENQAPLMITAAPYGPMWLPGDCTPEQKLPVTWEE